jgi:predicted metalloprotease with PDZ domain
MISENGTSSMLHELVHVAMGVAGSAHDDWVVEGLAEYYSIKTLRVTETLSNRRLELTLADLKEWGDAVDNLFVRRSSGPVTARATTLLAELDARLIEATAGDQSLDDVVAAMMATEAPLTYRLLCEAVRDVAGQAIDTLHPDAVPGAPDEPMCVDGD